MCVCVCGLVGECVCVCLFVVDVDVGEFSQKRLQLKRREVGRIQHQMFNCEGVQHE